MKQRTYIQKYSGVKRNSQVLTLVQVRVKMLAQVRTIPSCLGCTSWVRWDSDGTEAVLWEKKKCSPLGLLCLMHVSACMQLENERTARGYRWRL